MTSELTSIQFSNKFLILLPNISSYGKSFPMIKRQDFIGDKLPMKVGCGDLVEAFLDLSIQRRLSRQKSEY